MTYYLCLQDALHSGRLKINDSLRLMHSVGRLLATLPAESLFPSLEVIISPYFTQLNSLSSQQVRKLTSEAVHIRLGIAVR